MNSLREQLKKFKVKELKVSLKNQGLPTTGIKTDLIERLVKSSVQQQPPPPAVTNIDSPLRSHSYTTGQFLHGTPSAGSGDYAGSRRRRRIVPATANTTFAVPEVQNTKNADENCTFNCSEDGESEKENCITEITNDDEALENLADSSSIKIKDKKHDKNSIFYSNEDLEKEICITETENDQSSCNLVISGLSERTTPYHLKALFTRHGMVTDYKISKSGRCGFITMASKVETLLCIKKLNRFILHGQIITVERISQPLHKSKRNSDSPRRKFSEDSIRQREIERRNKERERLRSSRNSRDVPDRRRDDWKRKQVMYQNYYRPGRNSFNYRGRNFERPHPWEC